MDLLEASKLITREHVKEAARMIDGRDNFSWLYERTGRREPDHRYVVIDGQRFPSKAFGFLVAQIAGNAFNKSNDMNVNQAVAPLLRLGYVEVNGPGRNDTPEQRKAREESYYLTLARPDQASFRKLVMDAYNVRCVISGCSISTILEAAHVRPFRAQGEDTLANGLLLRINLHRLFDADELAIDPNTMLPVFSKSSKSYYSNLRLQAVGIPNGGPGSADLQDRWKAFKANES